MSTEPDSVETTATGKVEFVQYHQPGLKDGVYRVEVTQELRTTGAAAGKVPDNTFTAARTFLVAGERFTLAPPDVQAVFPADGSLGDHSNVLPHVILTRSTLPWERTPLASQKDGERKDLPWLALLLFDDDEKPAPSIATLGELCGGGASFKFPAFVLEKGQRDEDKVTVIDVKKSLLESILPSAEALGLLAHVRQGKSDAGAPDGDETAVVICNRLPKKGAASAVHLVSLEGRFVVNPNAGEQTGAPAYVFDYQGAADSDSIRLVTLKSWSFACADPRQDFAGLLTNLNRRFKDPGTLRLPPSSDAEAEQFLASGFVPLPHFLRHTGRTVSWYHGPLIPGANGANLALPARAADQLLRYDPRTGMFDVSYAAAWELGRLLALQSKQLSVGLYNWKRANAQRLKQDEQQTAHAHLPPLGQEPPPLTPPEDLARWFADLSLLRGVPFNYLVPDASMLPAESVRFFYLDGLWIDCLIDGAFSLGRVTQTDFAQTQTLKNELTGGDGSDKVLSGFLLRSDVVSGWPGLLVDAFDTKGQKLESLRTERLSASVLLCVFSGDGDVRRADIHQRPEMLHFGLDAEDTDSVDAESARFVKKLRDEAGEEDGPVIDSGPWLQTQTRVVDVEALAAAIGAQTGAANLTSAQLALQMIEGVERVSLYAAGSAPAQS